MVWVRPPFLVDSLFFWYSGILFSVKTRIERIKAKYRFFFKKTETIADLNVLTCLRWGYVSGSHSDLLASMSK